MVQIRRLSKEHSADYDSLARIASRHAHFFYESSDPSLPDAWLESVSSDSDCVVLGAFAGTKLVGLACLSRRTHPRWRHRTTVHQLYAADNDPDVLSSLVNGAMALAARQKGVHQVELEIPRGDPALLEVVSRTAFRYCGDIPGAILHERKLTDVHLFMRQTSPPVGRGKRVRRKRSIAIARKGPRK